MLTVGLVQSWFVKSQTVHKLLCWVCVLHTHSNLQALLLGHGLLLRWWEQLYVHTATVRQNLFALHSSICCWG